MEVEKFELIKNVNVLVFGDLMIDKYIIGNVSRISPEAPIPVIEIKKEESKLGGAGNVINNIKTLGANVRCLGVVGKDIEGNYLKEKLKELKVDVTFLKQDEEIKTITKTRIVSKNQQFVRCDLEEIRELPKKIQKQFTDKLDEIFDNIDVMVISDYGKGAINKKLSLRLIDYANKKNIPIIVDPKGNDYSKYTGATLCTPNMKELSIVSGSKLEKESEITKEGFKLKEKLKLKYLVLTRSEKGMSLFEEKTKLDFKAVPKEVIDVTGAGDTVVSTLALLLAINVDIKDAIKVSNIAASIVISKFGAATLSLNELISETINDSKFKFITKKTAKYIVASLKEKGYKVVFTNGCFDLLHIGHIKSFKSAKEFGDILIVAINSDASVKKYKGDNRPIINEEDRIALLCELECVDYVILMEDNEPSSLIKYIEPNICVKGEDWKDKFVPEKEVIESIGGEMKFIPLVKDHSTTKIIERILKVYE